MGHYIPVAFFVCALLAMIAAVGILTMKDWKLSSRKDLLILALLIIVFGSLVLVIFIDGMFHLEK